MFKLVLNLIAIGALATAISVYGNSQFWSGVESGTTIGLHTCGLLTLGI